MYNLKTKDNYYQSKNYLADSDIKKPIVLVGMMGVGKSTVGRILAKLLNLSFYDIDKEIEKISNFTIEEIFAKYGEPEFRRIEQEVINRMIHLEDCVIALGGGAFINDTTRSLIKDKAISIWLDANEDILFQRAIRRQNRPLVKLENPRDNFIELLAKRIPYYTQADFSVRADIDDPKLIAETVAEKLNLYLTNNLQS